MHQYVNFARFTYFGSHHFSRPKPAQDVFFGAGDTVVISLSGSPLEVLDNLDEQTHFAGEIQWSIIVMPKSESI